jgi:hypothetical protein
MKALIVLAVRIKPSGLSLYAIQKLLIHMVPRSNLEEAAPARPAVRVIVAAAVIN